MESLIEEMADRENITHFPELPFRHQQFSSYNRTSVSPDSPGWFENYDMSHFLRVDSIDGRREFVLLDTCGPGAVVRWWMTFYKAQNGVIRVYIDNDTAAVVVGTPRELLSGALITSSPMAVSLQKGAPLGEEGRDYDHNFYVPLPFSKHCKITYECDSIVRLHNLEGTDFKEGFYWPDVFYNIGCRLYDPAVRVESVTSEILIHADSLLQRASRKMNKEVHSDITQDFHCQLAPGDSIQLIFDKSGMAINRLVVNMEAENMSQALRSVVLSASFDDHRTIWTPVGAFFGTGYSLNPHITWMNQKDDSGRMQSNWIMPYIEHCKFTLINYGPEKVEIEGMVGLKQYTWQSNSMHFGASWHEYHHIQSRSASGKPYDLNFINIKGKGVYVGDLVSLFNNTYLWWGEGDEKIFVDGEDFPSSFGTGSEDYYGYSFARPEPFSHPFLSQPQGTGNTNWGLTVNMRLRSLDAIPFDDTLSANIELWHWANVPINYALTSYWYVKTPFETNIRPDIVSVKNPVAINRNDLTP